MKLLLQQLPGRQASQVLGDVNAALIKFQQFYLFTIFAGAKDDSQRWRFTGFLFIFRQPAQVELHLTFVGSLEFAELQFDRDQASQAAIVEQHVDLEVIVVNLQPFLAGDKTETGPQLQQKIFQFTQDCVFEIFFKVMIAQLQKIQNVGIF